VARRLDIYIDLTTGSRFTCPSCGAADCPAHDTEPVTWRHLETARAYRIRLAFQEPYEQSSTEVAAAFLQRWYFWATDLSPENSSSFE